MLSTPGSPPTCGVIFSSWPSWLFGLHLRGWKVKFSVHKGSVWASRITLWFREVIIFNIGDLTGNDSLEGASHWFSDVEPPRKIGLWHISAQTITTLRRIRHILNTSWKMHHYDFTHSNAGGLTDGSWSIYLYTFHDTLKLQIGNIISSRDLKSILSTTKEGLSCPPQSNDTC